MDNDEKLKKLIIVISRYRIFIMKYLDITKTQLIGIISRRLQKPESECHLSKLDLESSIKMIQDLKQLKFELTGSRRLPENVNPRKYALKIKEKLKEEN